MRDLQRSLSCYGPEGLCPAPMGGAAALLHAKAAWLSGCLSVEKVSGVCVRKSSQSVFLAFAFRAGKLVVNDSLAARIAKFTSAQFHLHNLSGAFHAWVLQERAPHPQHWWVGPRKRLSLK